MEDGDVEGVYHYVVEPTLHPFASYVFEDICREFVKELQKKNKLPFRYSKIDKCKFKGVPFSYSEYLDTKAKLAALQEKAKFYYALFSESGFNEKIIDEAKTDTSVMLFDLKQIVNVNDII